MTYIEQDCTITHEGKEFTSGGAVVTDAYVICYCSEDMRTVTTWHGETLGNIITRLTSKWRVESYIGSHMYQIHAMIDGKHYTGRTFGGGMSARLKRAKS